MVGVSLAVDSYARLDDVAQNDCTTSRTFAGRCFQDALFAGHALSEVLLPMPFVPEHLVRSVLKAFGQLVEIARPCSEVQVFLPQTPSLFPRLPTVFAGWVCDRCHPERGGPGSISGFRLRVRAGPGGV